MISSMAKNKVSRLDTETNVMRKVLDGPVYTLLAALLFGASVPLAKGLSRTLSPVPLAGLLYLGAGVGLGIWWLTSTTPLSSFLQQIRL